ncbi:AAA family ATPase [uncultured Anaerococcus sp.]|uniref:AAA family ATPase n=1 Tax=uncultured Anaerococcus sp. TaxID=293428 RepID=UPI0026254E7D|nr:AAA family ATPase [uncultured Anaerococcus sp.]
MKIIKIEMTDFRQYRGTHTIEFSVGNRNTTLILGNNGNGKTGIFRALMFALYGDISLSQDENKKNILLVNKDLIEENLNLPVASKVDLYFEDNGKDFIISRVIKQNKTGKNKVETLIESPKLFYINDNGEVVESIYKDETTIENFVNNIISHDIRDFFFFDAEEMTLLDEQKSTREISEDVKNGLIQLLQIKYLEDSKNEIDTKIKHFERDIKKRINDENLDKVNIRIDEINAEKQNLIDDNKNIKLQLNNISIEKEKVEEKLSENADIEKLYIKRNAIINTIKNKEETLKVSSKSSRNVILDAINLMAKDILQKNKLELNGFISNRSDQVPIDIINKSISECSCAVCMSKFENNSNQMDHLLKIKENYKHSGYTDVVRNILNYLDRLDNQEIEIKSSVHAQLEELINIYSEIENLFIKKDAFEDKIGDRADISENLKILKESLKKYDSDKLRLTSRQEINIEKIEKLRIELNKLFIDKEKLENKYEDTKILQEIRNKLQSYSLILENTRNSYIQSITDQLSKKIFNIFTTLLSSKDVDNYSEVTINKDFEIELLDNYGNNVINHLSMGQGQIFSLSFILSLANLASKGKDSIDFPLFMDSPLGRLDRENRKNIIQNVPKLTNQLILLLTDSEYTNKEKELFEMSENTEYIYNIINENGQSIIERLDI